MGRLLRLQGGALGSMKAAVFTEYGTSDALEWREVERPVPDDDEVLVRVHAVSINDWDWQILQGIPFMNRVSFGLLKPKRHILGSDIAGRVEAVGENVERFRPGDEVFGDLSGRWGGFAEFVCAREDALALKPAGMTFAEAAAIPQAAVLAVQGLRDAGAIGTGQRVLINGAGGGVGTFAVQIAKTYQAEITGVDSAGKLDLMRSLGCDHVVDYAAEDFTRGEGRYDLILDVKTDRPIRRYLHVLRRGGAYVTVGGATARIMQVLWMGPLISAMCKKRARVVILRPNKGLDYVAELYAAGTLRPVMDGHFSLSQAREGMRYFGEGRHKGKVVLTAQGGGS